MAGVLARRQGCPGVACHLAGHFEQIAKGPIEGLTAGIADGQTAAAGPQAMIPVREVDKTRKSSQPTGQHPYAIIEQLIVGGVVDLTLHRSGVDSDLLSLLQDLLTGPVHQSRVDGRQVEWRMRERFSARVERAGVQPKADGKRPASSQNRPDERPSGHRRTDASV